MIKPNKPGRPVGTTKPKTSSTKSIFIDDGLWARFGKATYNKSRVIADLIEDFLKDKP